MPASCAAASVRPTAPTCGSVKITRGDRAPSERSLALRPRIASAAIRPWYLPMCVSWARPLTSPIAYSQSWPGTRRSSLDGQRHARLESQSLESDPVRAGLTAEGHEQLVRLDARAVVERDREGAGRERSGSPRRRAARPRRARAAIASTCSLANGSSRGISRSPRCTSVTFDPSAPQACDISTPTTPPPRIAKRGGTALAVVALRLVQGFASRRPGMSGTRGVEPVATMTARRAISESWPADVDLQLPGDPRSPADERDAALLEPRHLAAVVEVVDHLVAACEQRRGVDAARGGARARVAPRRRDRPGATAPSRACTRRRSSRRRRATPRRSPRTGRARPACRPPPRRPGRRRSPRRRIRACAACRRMRAGVCYVSAVATRWYSWPMSGLESTKSAVARLQAIGTL